MAPENHLAEVVRSNPGRPAKRGKHHIPPLLCLCTLPRGGELFVNTSPNEFLGLDPPKPPPLETHFLAFFEGCEWGGGSKMSKK